MVKKTFEVGDEVRLTAKGRMNSGTVPEGPLTIASICGPNDTFPGEFRITAPDYAPHYWGICMPDEVELVGNTSAHTLGDLSMALMLAKLVGRQCDWDTAYWLQDRVAQAIHLLAEAN